MGTATSRALPAQVQDDAVTLLQNERSLTKVRFVRELEGRLSAQLMKTYLCRLDGVNVEVRSYIRRTPEENLDGVAERLSDIFHAIPPDVHPNLLPFQHWLQGTRPVQRGLGAPAFLIRQHLATNVYDRLSTRPFLSDCEKAWVVYQLFRAVEACHASGVVHGDIKSESVYITSFGFVVLSDFYPFKPTYLPDDDPTDFNFFFQSKNRHCYLAPERFFSSSPDATRAAPSDDAKLQVDDLMNSRLGAGALLEEAESGTAPRTNVESGGFVTREGQLRPYMDVWSLGCVVAEIYGDGGPILDLPALLSLRGAATPAEAEAVLSLGRLDGHPLARDLVRSMCQRDPSKRLPVRDYRSRMEARGLFPAAFGSALYPLFMDMALHTPSADERLSLVCAHYAQLLSATTGAEDPQGQAFFEAAAQVGQGAGGLPPPRPAGDPALRDRLAPFADAAADLACGSADGDLLSQSDWDAARDVQRLIEETTALIEEASRSTGGGVGVGVGVPTPTEDAMQRRLLRSASQVATGGVGVGGVPQPPPPPPPRPPTPRSSAAAA